MERNIVVQNLLLANLHKDGIIRKVSDTEYFIDRREATLTKAYPEVTQDTLADIREILRRVEAGLKKSGVTVTKPRIVLGG